MWVYAGKIPRDGPLVYQRCLAQAKVIEGGTPNIGLPVTQPYLFPGPQSPSHLLGQFGRWLRYLSQMKLLLRIEMGDSLIFMRMRQCRALLCQLGRGWAPDFWIPKSPWETTCIDFLMDNAVEEIILGMCCCRGRGKPWMKCRRPESSFGLAPSKLSDQGKVFRLSELQYPL